MTTDLKPGMKVSYLQFGQQKIGVIEGLSRDGTIVFLKDTPLWLHRESVKPCS